MTSTSLAIRYAAFAVLATLANLLAQSVVFAILSGPVALATALGLGTGCGLVVKFLLDKHWIFFDRTRDLRSQGRQFTLYCLMGLLTTALFWATELVFDAVFQDPAMRLLGGALGLSVGYWIKYRLDRRFVFASVAAP